MSHLDDLPLRLSADATPTLDLEPLFASHFRLNRAPRSNVDRAFCGRCMTIWPCKAVSLEAQRRALVRMRAAAMQHRETVQFLCDLINDFVEQGLRSIRKRWARS